MKATVRGPDGGFITVEHPEGATTDQIIAYAQANYKPTMGTTPSGEKVKFPAVIGMEGLGAAAKQVGEKKNVIGKIGTGLGTGWQSATQTIIPPEYGPGGKEARDIAAATTGGAGGIGQAAEIASLLPAAFALRLYSHAGRRVRGADRDALESTGHAPEDVAGRRKGGTFGLGTNLGFRALTGGLVRPGQEAQRVLDSGVTPTIGQTASTSNNPIARSLSRFEEKSQSFPFVGDFITRPKADFKRPDPFDPEVGPLCRSVPLPALQSIQRSTSRSGSGLQSASPFGITTGLCTLGLRLNHCRYRHRPRRRFRQRLPDWMEDRGSG